VQKLAAERLRKLNSGLVQVGAGVNFMHYIENEYRTKYLPDLAKPVRHCYESMIKVHLDQAFGRDPWPTSRARTCMDILQIGRAESSTPRCSRSAMH
jgi:hypothetical protein